MIHTSTASKFFVGWVATTILLIFFCLGIAYGEEIQTDIEKEIDSLSALEMAERG